MFDSLKPAPALSAELARLEKIFCEALGVTHQQISRHDGHKKLTYRLQRWAFWAIAYEITNTSYPELGRSLGFADHCTVFRGVRRLREILAADPKRAADYEDLKEFCDRELHAAA